MSVQVKICGIRSLDTAKAAADAGASFLGFNFVPSSKRYIDPSKAKHIADYISCDICNVGVFQDEDLEKVNQIAKDLELDYVQLHGSESPAYCSRVEVDLIKVFTLTADFDPDSVIDEMKKYSSYTNYFMIDKKKNNGRKSLDFKKSRKIAYTFPLILAGGLTPENIAAAIIGVNPLGVDVASGVETDGVQDIEKIKLFIKNAKGVS